MSWLIPFLRPLVPVAVDYARARIQTAQQTRAEAPESSTSPLEMRLSDAEAQVQALANLCTQLSEGMNRLSTEANARIRSARRWGLALLAWNLALSVGVIVLLLK